MEKLVISEERASLSPPVSVLTLKGTIETTNASGLEETLARIMDVKCYRIVVDLGGVTYISSAGWGIFISEIKRIRRNGGDSKLAAMVAGTTANGEIHALAEEMAREEAEHVQWVTRAMEYVRSDGVDWDSLLAAGGGPGLALGGVRRLRKGPPPSK